MRSARKWRSQAIRVPEPRSRRTKLCVPSSPHLVQWPPVQLFSLHQQHIFNRHTLPAPGQRVFSTALVSSLVIARVAGDEKSHTLQRTPGRRNPKPTCYRIARSQLMVCRIQPHTRVQSSHESLADPPRYIPDCRHSITFPRWQLNQRVKCQPAFVHCVTQKDMSTDQQATKPDPGKQPRRLNRRPPAVQHLSISLPAVATQTRNQHRRGPAQWIRIIQSRVGNAICQHVCHNQRHAGRQPREDLTRSGRSPTDGQQT